MKYLVQQVQGKNWVEIGTFMDGAFVQAYLLAHKNTPSRIVNLFSGEVITTLRD